MALDFTGKNLSSFKSEEFRVFLGFFIQLFSDNAETVQIAEFIVNLL